VQTPALPGQQLIAPVPPTAGRVGQVSPVGIANETKVVFAGTLPVNTTLTGDPGPAFVSVCRKVMLLPTLTGLGDAVVVSIKSNCPAVATVTIAVELLLPGFESVVVELVLAVFEIFVPEAVPAPTVTVNVKVVVAPEGNEANVH
jgi:hypothetical protein